MTPLTMSIISVGMACCVAAGCSRNGPVAVVAFRSSPHDALAGYAAASQPDASTRRAIAERNWRLIAAARSRSDPTGTADHTLGIACSGGGIRSAFTAIGVMKALRDHRIEGSETRTRLDLIRHYSATSGGTYALAWLMSRAMRDGLTTDVSNITEFTDDVHFQREIAELCAYSNMYSFQYGLRVLISPKTSNRDAYRESIWRTFRPHHPSSDVVPRMGDDYFQHVSLPSFVYTAKAWTDSTRTVWDQVFEMNRMSCGNDAIGWTPWDGTRQGSGDIPDRFLSGAIDQCSAVAGAAASGALGITIPWPALRQSAPFYAVADASAATAPRASRNTGSRTVPPAPYPGPVLFLSDGGHNENLAVLPLIRRAVKNIILVDAGCDPTYALEDYRNLQSALMREMGLELSIPAFDQPGAMLPGSTSVFPGAIRGLTIAKSSTDPIVDFVFNVYYVKLSPPVFGLSACHAQLAGNAVAYEQLIGPGRVLGFHNLIRKIPGGAHVRNDMQDAYARIQSLPQWSYGLAAACVQNYGTYARISGDRPMFPHPTTFDQSYYLDEARAVISVGMLLGMELNACITARPIQPSNL